MPNIEAESTALGRTARLPNNLEAERALLGCLILDNRLIADACDVFPGSAIGGAFLALDDRFSAAVEEPLFFSQCHQIIFGCLMTLHGEGRGIDLTTLGEELSQRGQYEAVGGAPYLATLENDIFSTAQVPEYARIITEKWKLRKTYRKAEQISRLALEPSQNGNSAKIEALAAEIGRIPGEGVGVDLSRLPRVLSAAEFVAQKRPALQYHIDGILPFNGKMTLSATSKFGKSMLGIQLGLAMAAGDCEWLGWKFGPSAKVLYVQAEIMDPLLEARMNWILNTLPPDLNQYRAVNNFTIQEIASCRPNLISPKGRATVEKLLEIHQPQVIIFDPLAALHPGMDENKGDQMGPALDYLSGLAHKFNCAIILIHHFNKSGTARGHSSFEGWPESDLQADYVSDDDHGVAKIISRLRCVFNPGALYLQMPSPGNPWFERMPPNYVAPGKAGKWASGQSARSGAKTGPKSEISDEDVLAHSPLGQDTQQATLTRNLMGEYGKSKATWGRHIDAMIKNGKIDHVRTEDFGNYSTRVLRRANDMS